jgi:serine/threonine protein kinase
MPADESKDLEELLAHYVDRLNEGEHIGREEILARNPVHGPKLIEHLEGFIEWTVDTDSNQPLGTLGDYTLRRQVGRGGMGVVYEAWENSMDRRVALKVLPAAVAADNKAFLRFLREAKAAGQLSHPNVVPVFAMGVKEQTPYYAMEYVEGETLAQVLAKLREIDPDGETAFGKKDSLVYFGKLAEAFAEVADGLQHAHAKKVIHRDIKPSNLILDGEARFRILDFGLALLEGQESLTFSGDFVGTPQYMSPEQARRKKIAIDHRTDVYSLGATMYETITDRAPFRGKDHADTLSQILSRDPVEPRKLNPRVPKDLDTIVLKCLRKETRDRYGTAEALEQDLRRFVRGDAIEARPQGRPERFVRLLRRNSRSLVLASLATGLALLAGAIAMERMAEQRRNRLQQYERVVEQAYLSLQLQSLTLGLDDPRNYYYLGFLGLGDFQGRLQALKIDALRSHSELLPERPEAQVLLAQASLLQGDRESAVRNLKEALRAAPSFVPASLLLEELEPLTPGGSTQPLPGWALPWKEAFRAMRVGDHTAAARWYTEVLQWTETNGEPFLGSSIEARLARGQARLSLKDIRALCDFEVVRARFPHALEPALLLGKGLHVLGFPQVADEVFSEIHLRTELKDDACLWMVYTYRKLADLDRAAAWTARIGGEALRERVRSMVLQAKGEVPAAVAAAERAIELEPSDPRNHECLVRLLELDPRLAEVLERTLGLFPEDPGLRSWVPWLRFRQGRHEEGERAARDFLGRTGPHWQVQEHLAMNLFRLGKIAESVAEFERLVRSYPLYDRGHMGWAFFCLGRLEEAHKAVDRCLELYPSDEWCLRMLAMIHRRLGDTERATRFLERASRAAPWHPWTQFISAFFLEQSGDQDAALERYIQLLPSRPANAFLHYCLAAILERAEEYQLQPATLRKLGTSLDTILQEDPTRAAVRHLRALDEMRLPEPDFDRIGKLLSLDSRMEGDELSAFCLTARAEALWRTGRRTEALEAIDEALVRPHATRWAADLHDRYRKESRQTGLPLPRASRRAGFRLESGPSSGEETRTVRINCGGGDFVDRQGRSWSSDRYFIDGWPYKLFELGHLEPGGMDMTPRPWTPLDDRWKFHDEIPGTDDDYLFQTHRWWHPSEGQSGYAIPVPNGSYTVRLHFAEVWFRAAGLRSFDVSVEEEAVARGVDVFAQAGASVPFVIASAVQVRDEVLDIVLRSERGYPFIAAIEVEPR